ncbi:MAG: hypothetical protein D6785_04210 [Planctomycetota bacterium]|nr:MAG: hypothetical protein D6785_04210 [Planctomycetota bacterium]
MKDSVELRTFTYLDVLQPQTASFIATVAQGYLPVEGQASLYVEIAPGIAINRLTDIALKKTDVRPGMQIVERAYGILELHAEDQGETRSAGEAILESLGLSMEDRLEPRILTSEIITGIDAHHTMLINRMRHGQMILKGESFYTLEVHPAGYAMLAANEAEKASPINVLEIRGFGAFGRVYLGGGEEEIREAQKAVQKAMEAIKGRENLAGEKHM